MGMTKGREHYDLLAMQRGIIHMDDAIRTGAPIETIPVLGMTYDSVSLGGDGLGNYVALASKCGGQANVIVRGAPNVLDGNPEDIVGEVYGIDSVLSQTPRAGIYIFKTPLGDKEVSGSIQVHKTPEGLTAMHIEVPSAMDAYAEARNPVADNGIDVV